MQLLLDGGEVGERQLGVDRLDVRDRVDAARDVHDVVVDEAAHDVRDRVGLADVGEELVAEALALRGAGDEARDVDELDDRRHDALGARDRRQRREPRVRHLDDADVRLDRAERIVLGGDAGLGQRVEERRLADVRQADDAAFEAHWGSCSLRVCRRQHRALEVAVGDGGPGAERIVDGARRSPRARPRAAVAARSRRPAVAGSPSRADGRCRGAAARIRRAELGSDVAQPVVAGVPAAELHLALAGLEVELVVDDQDLVRRDVEEPRQRGDRRGRSGS